MWLWDLFHLMLPVAPLKEKADGSGVYGYHSLCAAQGPDEGLLAAEWEPERDRLLRKQGRRVRPEEERGHGNFYREIGTKTVCPRFQGAEWKKMAHFSISSGQPCSCQAFMPCLTGDLSVGRGGGRWGLPPLRVWKVLAKWKWFYKWVYALKVSCPCLLPVILHSMSPHRGPLPEAVPVEKLTIRQGFFSF